METTSQTPTINLSVPHVSEAVQDILDQYHESADPLPEAQQARMQQLTAEIEQSSDGLPDCFEIRPCGDPVGQGVFLKEDAPLIQEGEPIGIYTGEYLLLPFSTDYSTRYIFEVLSDIKLRKKEIRNLFNGWDCPRTGKRITHKTKMFLACDAEHMGNFTRYINQGDPDHVNIAAETYQDVIDGKPVLCVGYFASKTILPGHQLLIDYGEEYWESLEIDPIKLRNDDRSIKF